MLQVRGKVPCCLEKLNLVPGTSFSGPERKNLSVGEARLYGAGTPRCVLGIEHILVTDMEHMFLGDGRTDGLLG